MTDLQQDMRGGTNDPKRAPANFEEDEDDVGDVEENLGGGPRGRPGPSGNQYRTATTENQNQAMQIDQRGTQRKRRASSSRRRKSTGKKGNQMANKSYASSEMGGDESHNGDPEFSKDFNSAYAKLVEKIYQEQGNTLLISQDEIYKLEHSVIISYQIQIQKQKQLNEENFRQRISEFEENKRRKLLEQQELTKDKDLDGCTFQPQLMTHHASSPEPKRNLDQFLQDQNKFLEKVQKKREDAKNQTAQEEVSVMQPSIDDYSRRIVEEKMSDRKNKTTYERLYDLNKEQQQKKLQKQQDIHDNAKAATQHTVANVRDKAELERSLYEDAERRRRDLAKKKEELDKTRDQPKEKYYHNDTSDKYVAKRLERELQQLEQDMAVQEMAEEEHEDGEPENKKQKKNISFAQMQEILAHMGFVPNKPVLDSTDQQLCQDLWTLVKGEDREGVAWETLRILFLNFIGIKTPDQEREAPQEETSRIEDGDLPAEHPENKSVSKLGFFDEDVFYLKKGSHQRLFAYFKNFYVNRVGFIGGMKKVSQSSHGPELQQKPQISDKSARLAENKRKKLLGDREVTSTVEIFLLPKHNEAQLQERRKQMQDREVDGCTFRPQTLKYQSTNQQQESAGFRGETLYQSKPKGWFVEKGHKTQDEVEFEKGNQDCTFRPSINDPSSLQALNDGSVGQVKGIDKQMERMNKARQNQLEKKLMTERGMPAQLMASIGRPEPSMNFSSNKNKFASGFGVDGSQIKPPRRNNNFADSQRIDQRQLQQVRQSQPKPQAQQQTRPVQQQKPVKQATRKPVKQQQQYQQVPQQQIQEHHYEEEEQIQNVQAQQQQQQMHRNNSKTGSNRQFVQQQQQQQEQQQQQHQYQQEHTEEEDHYNHQQEEEHQIEEQEESQQIQYAQEEEQEEEYEEQYEVEHQVTHHVIRGQQENGQQEYVEEEETYQEEVREGMNETDYEGQQFQEQESSEQSPVKSQNDREPMLYVDVNLGNSGTQRIVVFEGDTAEGLAEKFATEYQLDDGMKEKLTLMLQSQIAGVLEKIEEVQSNNSDNNIME